MMMSFLLNPLTTQAVSRTENKQKEGTHSVGLFFWQKNHVEHSSIPIRLKYKKILHEEIGYLVLPIFLRVRSTLLKRSLVNQT